MSKHRVAALIGVFDLLHEGHIALLEKASAASERLIVLIVEDQAVKRQKGADRPHQSLAERISAIQKLQHRGRKKTMQNFEVVAVPDFDPTEAMRVAKAQYGSIDCFFLGEDQSHIKMDGVRALGIPIQGMLRTPGVSTSEKIASLYDRNRG